MKDSVRYALGLIILGVMVWSAGPARADLLDWWSDDCSSWDKKDVTHRFIVLKRWNNEAVLDRETCLVWEQSPSTDTSVWLDAQKHCDELIKGNRLGWRLPTLQELASLADPSGPDPSLPSGHPFSNVQSDRYWSATTSSFETSEAWYLDFASSGEADTAGKTSDDVYAWCVRGGQGVNPQ